MTCFEASCERAPARRVPPTPQFRSGACAAATARTAVASAAAAQPHPARRRAHGSAAALRPSAAALGTCLLQLSAQQGTQINKGGKHDRVAVAQLAHAPNALAGDSERLAHSRRKRRGCSARPCIARRGEQLRGRASAGVASREMSSELRESQDAPAAAWPRHRGRRARQTHQARPPPWA